jgi:flagellar FliJ protein
MPRTFRFSLETVRSLREQAELRAREALARELALSADRRSEAAAAAARLADPRAATALVPGASPAMGAIRLAQTFVERCEQERARTSAIARAQDEAVERRRAGLVAASRDREALERLKERHRAAHDREELRQERAELAEVTLARHARPLGGVA